MAKEVKQNAVLKVLTEQEEIMGEKDLVKEMKIAGNRVRAFLSRLKTKEQ